MRAVTNCKQQTVTVAGTWLVPSILPPTKYVDTSLIYGTDADVFSTKQIFFLFCGFIQLYNSLLPNPSLFVSQYK